MPISLMKRIGLHLISWASSRILRIRICLIWKRFCATVDVAAIAQAKHRVLLDSNHGAGGLLGKRLLEKLGCEVVLVGETPDGQFAHVPEPTADNLQGIAERVRAERCAVGFCQDPDADRLALVDGAGRYIGEEYTLALCVQRAMSAFRHSRSCRD